MKLSQKSLQYKVLRVIQENELICPGQKIIVAVSGGADSVCLFDLFFKLKDELKITLAACHYNHKMRGKKSCQDAEFVQKLAESRGVEFIGGSAQSGSLLMSEESARKARFTFFEKILKKGRGDEIALAHNKNDFIETFFLRLLRGGSMRGLKSIPYRRQKFIRPLLDISRSEIEHYLKKEGLDFRNDQTNLKINYTRNFFRLKIMPLILQINPNLLQTLAGNISALEEDFDFINNSVEKAFEEVTISEKNKQIILSQKKWLLLHPAMRTGVIRYAISKIAILDDITYKQISDAVKMLKKGDGKKFKPLPHSLRISLESGKIIILVE